jgi:hypothetical protein
MADKKEKETVKELKEVVEPVFGKEEKVKSESKAAEDVLEKALEQNEEQISGLDMLWRNAFQELDEWAAHAEFRDEVFLKETMFFVDSIKRNQGNLKAVSEQFYKELLEWEKVAREEFLMSTTTLQHFFPIKSYEEINEQIDNFQKRTLSIINAPYQAIANFDAMDKYLQIVERYISLRKRGRLQYLKTIKHAGDLVYENQKGFVNLFSRQIQTLMFPLNKYLEKAEEISKS